VSCDVMAQAVNDETGDVDVAFDHDHKSSGRIAEVAKAMKSRREPWALVVDENYGEVCRPRLLPQLSNKHVG
jgi:homoaconitase